MEHYYRISRAAQLMGVCSKTIRRWDARGKIKCKRTLGGHRRISIFEIKRVLNGDHKEARRKNGAETAIYCRVSAHEQKKKGDLERQKMAAIDFCNEKGYEPKLMISDVGSGLNTRRRGMKKLCKLLEEGKVNRVVLTYSDRLTRFGFDYLESYFKSHGATIQVINKNPDCSVEEELVQDLIAIITSFSGRVHGMRSHKNKKKKKKF